MDSKDNSEKIYPTGYEPKENNNVDANVRNQLLNQILKSSPTEFINTDLFIAMRTGMRAGVQPAFRVTRFPGSPAASCESRPGRPGR